MAAVVRCRYRSRFAWPRPDRGAAVVPPPTVAQNWFSILCHGAARVRFAPDPSPARSRARGIHGANKKGRDPRRERRRAHAAPKRPPGPIRERGLLPELRRRYQAFEENDDARMPKFETNAKLEIQNEPTLGVVFKFGLFSFGFHLEFV